MRGSCTSGTDIGVYVTMDGGATWSVLGGNLPSTYVHDIVIHPRDRMIVAATHGRGHVGDGRRAGAVGQAVGGRSEGACMRHVFYLHGFASSPTVDQGRVLRGAPACRTGSTCIARTSTSRTSST